MLSNVLKKLEEESIYIMREVAGQFNNPCILFSGGKDSIILVYLAKKAFRPANIPFPVLHIDTGHNFPETIIFRDNLIKKLNINLIIRYVQDSINNNRVKEEQGKYASRNILQTTTLLDSIEEFKFDACIGGGRRDEEKSRAKERIFSIRDSFGQWNEKLQRPELFDMYNGKIYNGENVRVFPISNWTELDVWNYIKHEKIEIPSIYFSHKREVFYRKKQLMPNSKFINIKNEKIFSSFVRFRTIGDMTCTCAIKSLASNLDDIIKEIINSSISERGARIDDQRSEGAMEERKKIGYF